MAKIPLKKKPVDVPPPFDPLGQARDRVVKDLQTTRHRLHQVIDEQLNRGTVQSMGVTAMMLEGVMRAVDLLTEHGPVGSPAQGGKPGKTSR